MAFQIDLHQQHTLALLSRLDLLVRREVARARAERGQRPDEGYRGLYVSEGDVGGMLECDTASQPADGEDLPEFKPALMAADRRIDTLAGQCRATGEVPRVDRLLGVVRLFPF